MPHKSNDRGYVAERKATAKASAEKRAQRTNKQQLALLDQRLGEGVGAHKERARLSGAITPKKGRGKRGQKA